MELYLIRHGESTNNVLVDMTNRVADPPLTANGERQAARIAALLAARAHLDPAAAHPQPLDRLYCSAMLRAMQTAEAIGRHVGIAPELWLDVHEVGGIYLDHGDTKVGYPGCGRGELGARFPNCVLPHDLPEDGWWNRAFEEREQGIERAARVARMLREGSAEDTRIAIVSHGDFISFLLHELFDHRDGAEVYYEHRNTAITCVELTPAVARPRYLNRCDHLEDGWAP